MIRLTATEQNPLTARRARKMGLRLGLAAAALLTGASLVLSANLSAPTQPSPTASQTPAVEQTQAVPAAEQAKPAKKIRVIQLFNVPKDQQGL